MGTVATATASGDGAANAVAHITGTTATKLLWPEDSIPTTFTFCHVTRWTGGSRGRILTCRNGPSQDEDWFHGHHWSRRGVAAYGYHPEWYKTNDENVGNHDDWLVMCGTNAGPTAPGNIILDQDEIGTSSGGLGSCRLNIGYYQPSDWALHSVLIWDYSLGTVPVPWHDVPYLNIQFPVVLCATLSMVQWKGVWNGCLRAGRRGT